MTARCRLHVELRPDRPLASRAGDTVHIRATVTAVPETQATRPAPRALNLALALDASGSMGDRGKMETARKASLGIVSGLGPDDLFSLVSFGDAAVLHLEAVRMDAEGKAKARAAIAAVEADGMTALSEGWFTAAQCLAPHLGGARASRVILVSDGKANRGIKDPAELAHHAGMLSQGGIATTAVGVGDGYDAQLMQGIAAHGGGQMHDAEDNDEIVEVLAGEIRDLRDLAFDGVSLDVSCGGLPVTVLSALPSTSEGTVRSVSLGALGSGRSRDVVLRVDLPADGGGAPLMVEATALGQVPGADAARSQPGRCIVNRGSPEAAAAAPRDADVARAVMVQRHARMVARVVAMNRAGQGQAAAAYLDARIPAYTAYANGLPGAEALVEGLADMRAGIGRAWDERARKNLDVFAYKSTRGENDYRTRVRGDLTKVL